MKKDLETVTEVAKRQTKAMTETIRTARWWDTYNAAITGLLSNGYYESQQASALLTAHATMVANAAHGKITL